MKVIVIGHSYVKGLQRLGDWNITKTLEDGNKVLLDFRFSFHLLSWQRLCTFL